MVHTDEKKKEKEKEKKKWISFDTLPFLTALDSWEVETSEKEKKKEREQNGQEESPIF